MLCTPEEEIPEKFYSFAFNEINRLGDDINFIVSYDKIQSYKDGKCIYCLEETHLRSHVMYPLLMGLYDHKDEIKDVLFDEKLFIGNGFKTIDNTETFWDRVTLMAIRGLFNADY